MSSTDITPANIVDALRELAEKAPLSKEEIRGLWIVCNYLEDWAKITKFYADSHYDGGLRARRVFGKSTVKDRDKEGAAFFHESETPPGGTLKDS